MAAHRTTAVSKFASFFKGYGIALGVIMAAIPLVTKFGSLLPVYAATKDILTFSTSLLSFLAIAVLFGVRRQIGQAVFPNSPGECISSAQHKRRISYGTTYPILLGTLGACALAAYLLFIHLSIQSIADRRVTNITKEEFNLILSDTPLVAIPYLGPISIAYAVMFLGSATAFVWLGLIEYVQNELGITDAELVTKPYVEMNRLEFKLSNDPNANDWSPYFICEYDPRSKKSTLIIQGPYCGTHRRLLFYEGTVFTGRHQWLCCENREKKQNGHNVSLNYDTVDIRNVSTKEGEKLVKARVESSMD